MGYAVAAAVAVPVGFIDQFGRLRARPAFRGGVWIWWALRIVLECTIAVATLYAAVHLDIRYSDEWYGWLAAGLIGASLAKSHLAEFGRGDREVAYGLISFYERVRAIFEGRINTLSASHQSTWINDKILPALQSRGVTAEEVADKLEDYVRGLGGLGDFEREQEVAWIQSTRQESISEDLIRKALVRRAVEMRAWDWLKTLAAG